MAAGGEGHNPPPPDDYEEEEEEWELEVGGGDKISKLIRVLSRVDSRSSYHTAIQKISFKLGAFAEDRHYLINSWGILCTTLGLTFKGLASVKWYADGVSELSGLLIEIYHVFEREEGVGCGKSRVISWLVQLLLQRASQLQRERTRLKIRVQVGRSPPKHILLIHDAFIGMITGLPGEEVEGIPALVLAALEDQVEDGLPFTLLCTMFAHAMNQIQIYYEGEEAAAAAVGGWEASPSYALFPDFVDVVIGWLVDGESGEDTSIFCGPFLALLRPHFVSNSGFTRTLLNQILEDMDAQGVELENGQLPVIKKVTLLIRAYGAMLGVGCVEDKTFVNEGTERVTRLGGWVLTHVVASSALDEESGKGGIWEEPESTEWIYALLSAINGVLPLSPGVDGEYTRAFIKGEIELFSINDDPKGRGWSRLMRDEGWEGICCWLEGALGVTQLSPDTLTFAHSLFPVIDAMDEGRIKVLLVQSLFRTRNIPFLQSVWEWHLAKLETSGFKAIPFILAGLADIAGNKSGSILTLYALDPSIFDLLVYFGRREDLGPEKRRPILDLLRLHSSIHSHWVAAASLGSSEYSSTSPGARFLPALLQFWLELLYAPNYLTSWDKVWLIEWITEFLAASPAYAPIIYAASPTFFQGLFRFICLPCPVPPFGLHDQEEEEAEPEIEYYCRSPPPKYCPPQPKIEEEPDKISLQRLRELCYAPSRPLGTKKAVEPGSNLAPHPQSTLNTPENQDRNTAENQERHRTGLIGDDDDDEWPYLFDAIKLFKMMTDPDSNYASVVELQSLLTTFCTETLFPLDGNKKQPPPWDEVMLLLTKVVTRLGPLLVLERTPTRPFHPPEDLEFLPQPKEVEAEEQAKKRDKARKEISMLEWMEATEAVPQDYTMFMMPVEFNEILDMLLPPAEDPNSSNNTDEDILGLGSLYSEDEEMERDAVDEEDNSIELDEDYEYPEEEQDSDEQESESSFLASEISSLDTGDIWDEIPGPGGPPPPTPFQIRSSLDYLLRAKLRTPLGTPKVLFTYLVTVFRDEDTWTGSGNISLASSVSSVASSRPSTAGDEDTDSGAVALESNMSGGHVPLTPVLGWKFDWIWLLEQGFILWTQGSSSNIVAWTEGVKTFFETNKIPCFEWFRRHRSEIGDAASASGHHHHSFYHAGHADDWPRAQVALLHLNDADGLRGKDELGPTVEAAARLYIQGRFQEALTTLEQIEEDSSTLDSAEEDSSLRTLVAMRCQRILELDPTSLLEPEEVDNYASPLLTFLLPPQEEMGSCLLDTSILDTQLAFLLKTSYKGGHTHMKTGINTSLATDVGDASRHSLWTLLKLNEALRILPCIPLGEKRPIWLELGQRMLDSGNLEWVERFLTRFGVQIHPLLQGVAGANWLAPNPTLFLGSHEKDTCGTADFLALGQLTTSFLLARGALFPAAQLTVQLLLLHANGGLGVALEDSPATAEDLEACVQLLLRLGGQLEKLSMGQILRVFEDLGWRDELVGFMDDTQPLLKMLDKALALGPIHPQVWLALGNAYYDIPGTPPHFITELDGGFSITLRKRKALEAYTNHLRYSPDGSSSGGRRAGDLSLVTVISRVITMIRDEDGGKSGWDELNCDHSQLFMSPRWLDFLPEVATTPILRSYVLQRFPDKAAMFLWPHDADSVSNPGSTSLASLGRKGLFDPRSAVLVDINQEPFTPLPALLTPPPSCCTVSTTYRPTGPRRRSVHTMTAIQHPPPPPVTTTTSSTSSIIRYCSRSSDLGSREAVALLGRELLRIGTSSEELWSWTLNRILSDWNRRISSLKKDLSREYETGKILMYILPVVTFLEEMWMTTVTTADSPAQMSFLLRNGDVIPAILEFLKSGRLSLEGVLREFEKLLFHSDSFDSHIQARAHLNQISPHLSNWREWSEERLTLLGMPGGVHIIGLHPTVTALPTKTKPKKVRFLASDGKSYDYLVKGNENLNVDAGMMQLFTLAQAWIGQPVWTYAVTPLGNRGGLIQMVEGATPVFQLYKRYLQSSPNSLLGEKTSEMYWRLMTDHGVEQNQARSSIEPSVLRQVYAKLVDDAPKDLISKEILLASPNVRHWFNAVKGFSRDSGVSAALGYLLGIGDRHLDNILVDFSTGKLVHVDFSLVFERGQKLRVPEVVPFRLTPNFEEALAYPGVRGGFSSTMETTLNCFKTEVELSSFFARNLAFAGQIEEDYVANPHPVRVAEVNSALHILAFRYNAMTMGIRAHRVVMVTAMEEFHELEATLQETMSRVAAYEASVEQNTIAMGLLKDAEYDTTKRSQLHARIVIQSHFGRDIIPTPLSPVEDLLLDITALLADQLGETQTRLEDPVYWATNVEAHLTSALQSAVQSKFDAGTAATALKSQRSLKVISMTRLINKWRRLLGNLDPFLVLLATEVQPVGDQGQALLGERWVRFKEAVISTWFPASHSWLHIPVDDILVRLLAGNDRTGGGENGGIWRETEILARVVEDIGEILNTSLTTWPPRQDQEEGGLEVVTERELTPLDPTMEWVDKAGITGVVNKFRDKVVGFNVSSSVDLLVTEAKSEANLCRMFEGWTPWI